MARHLMLRLASPLIAFGGETIDNQGVIRDFPALSMLTGLIANALGWDRGQDRLHNRLQQRLRMGTALAPGFGGVHDYQTAELFEDEEMAEVLRATVENPKELLSVRAMMKRIAKD